MVADIGFEIVHVRLSRYLPLQAGFDAIRAHIAGAARPINALCGMELRSPRPFTFPGFDQFNASYVDVLRASDILVDGMNPVARTNVAPEVDCQENHHFMVSRTPRRQWQREGPSWWRSWRIA